jgi:DNA modification methylase
VTTTILRADVLDGLAEITDGAAQCCGTSPPYFGLRSYLPVGHADKPLEIGTEATPGEYVAKLVKVFRQVRRVLRDDGICWLNISDSYSAKGLLMVPSRVAIALQADGWYLRADVIWQKTNAQPESVKDRPTRSHEHVFLLSKSARYHYDAAAVAEPVTAPRKEGPGAYRGQAATRARAAGDREQSATLNLRDVWSISARPFEGAHLAVMPPELAARCIRAGSANGDLVLDPFLGTGTVGLVAGQLGREAVGCELNHDYADLARRRLRDAGQQAEIYQVGTDLVLAA